LNPTTTTTRVKSAAEISSHHFRAISPILLSYWVNGF
jgi:hypothetical protein